MGMRQCRLIVNGKGEGKVTVTVHLPEINPKRKIQPIAHVSIRGATVNIHPSLPTLSFTLGFPYPLLVSVPLPRVVETLNGHSNTLTDLKWKLMKHTGSVIYPSALAINIGLSYVPTSTTTYPPTVKVKKILTEILSPIADELTENQNIYIESVWYFYPHRPLTINESYITVDFPPLLKLNPKGKLRGKRLIWLLRGVFLWRYLTEGKSEFFPWDNFEEFVSLVERSEVSVSVHRLKLKVGDEK